jgi:NAD(P)H dehydrogenase (quinone)
MSTVLSVVAHPSVDSFSKAVSASVLAGAVSAGATTVESDLYRNGFDPRFSLSDFELFQAGGDGTAAPDVLAEQEKLLAADAIVFVFPVYWWSVPGYLKSYIDRVITRGFAYGHDAAGGSIHKLAGKRVRLVALTASPETTYVEQGFKAAMKTQLERGIFELYCGVEDVALEFFWGVTKTSPGSTEAQALLDRAFQLGASLA